MGASFEMLLLGLGLVIAGAIIAYLVWMPVPEEDRNRDYFVAHVTQYRLILLAFGLAVAGIGLTITLWQLYRLIAGLIA